MIIPDGLEDYRPNVGVCVLNREGRVWLGTRAGVGKNEPLTEHRWQMPQGGIDDGEAPDLAAFRELREETNITSVRLLTMTPGWLAYDFPAEYRKKRWKGQRQKWAVMLFEGEDSEVDLEADDHVEFDDWRWASLSEAAALVVPFKRAVYEELIASIAPLAAFVAACGGVPTPSARP